MRRRTLLLASVLGPTLPGLARGAGPLRVVATFSVLGDMVRQIANDRVALTVIVGPDGDSESYEPTAADAHAVAEADLLVMNGLNKEFEPWLPGLLAQAGFHGTKLVATDGVRVLTVAEEKDKPVGGSEGELDQHAWQDAANGAVYASNIQAALVRLDPANAKEYQARGDAYRKEILDLDAWVKQQMASVPPAKRKVITSHDAFAYFGRAYGVRLIGARGLTTEKEPSAQQVGELIEQIKEERVRALFIENMSDPRLVERVAQETGARVGGELFSDALSKPGEGGDTYVAMFRHNVAALRAGMAQN
jgi:zinc/manganese transport system substrate-binding protein